MKWSVIALVALGTVAALCATVLVGALRSSDRADAAEGGAQVRETTIVVAARDLSPGTIIEGDALATKQITLADAPEGFIADPVLAVGKVLNVTMVEGQPFFASGFASEGSGLHLAAALPKGMRAVGISLGGSSGLRGLLHPGCAVDVLATTQGGRGSAPKTRILLERVRVLGIEDHTIVSSQNSRGGSGRSYNRSEMVLLMLDVFQARRLQSAVQSGTISLVLRHPLDEAAMPVEEPREEVTVAQLQPEPKEGEAEEAEEAEEHVTEEVNGGTRAWVTYVKQGDSWQRKSG